MKRIIASAGLAAVGAASVQAAYTPGLTPMEQSKPWAVTVAVRGFYDDNMFSRPDDSGGKEESFGVSVNPTVALNFALDRTLISFNYSYDFRWFEARTENEADHIQQAKLGIAHAFSERFSVDLWDRFIYAQEGAVAIDAGPVTVPGRSDGDYFRNIANVDFDAGVTERLSVLLGYRNEIWDFENSGFNSYSARLDRMEHLGTVEGSWEFTPHTSGLIGYKFGDVRTRSNDQIFVDGVGAVDASERDRLSHSIYAGVEHDFSQQLTGALRAGVQLIDYNEADVLSANGFDDNATSPYIDGVVSWNYNPGSTLKLGVVNTMNSTDVSAALSQSSVAVYLDLNHRITPEWTFGAMLLFQNSSFEGGVYDGDNEQLFVAGVNVDYLISQHLSAEVGYAFDLLSSDVDDYFANDVRGFDRNRVYVGLRARF
jgi:opacity protein-like surface antigen